MDSTQFYLQEFIDIVWKRKRLILLFLALVVVIVTLGTLRQPKIYRAETILEVGVETPDITFYKETVTTNPENWWSMQTYYETQFKILKSRSLMGVVADKIIERGIVKEMSRDSLIGWLQGGVAIFPQEKSRLVTITMSDTVPDRAARISDLVADTYVEENLNKRVRGAKEGVEILSQQIDLFRDEKEKSDRRVQEFKERHNIVSLEARQNAVKTNLVSLNETLNAIKNERILVEAKHRALKEIFERSQDFEKLLGSFDGDSMGTLRSEYSELMRSKDEMLKRYKEKHPEVVALNMRLSSIENSIRREAQAELARLETQYRLAKAQEESVMRNLDIQKKEALKIDALNLELETISSIQSTNRNFYEGLNKKLKEADLTGLIKSNNIRVVDRALVPRVPIKPKVRSNVLMAIIFGLLGGIGLAYFIESLDNTVKTEEDVEKYAQVPVLGMIPFYEQKEGEEFKKIELLPIRESSSNISEMYRTIRTNLAFLSTEKGYKVFQITSAGAKEGKTTTAVNLGASLAQFGSKTVLIDLDLRKSRLSSVLEVGKENGISDYLIGNEPITNYIKQTGVKNLDVITSGALPPNPAELIGSSKLKSVLYELKDIYNNVIIDSSPIAPVTDSLILAQIVDGVIFVVGSERTAKSILKNSKDQLKKVNANILGGVLNAVHMEKKKYLSKYYNYGYYRYGYYYKSDEDADEKTPKPEKRIDA